ncbi:MAG: Ig-like domain-containing protein [Muribaculaceae bacterium]|nr:Ig-like domain-containing protein [Muribaculaceae bacterium]
MNRKYIIAFLMLLMLAAPFGAAADRFYIEPVDMKLGETGTLQFILDNSQDYYGFQAEVRLPEGLQVIKGSDGELDITLTSRAGDGDYRINSNMLSDESFIMGSFTANSIPFKGDSGVLVNLSVSVADDFAGGTVEVSNIMFIDGEAGDVAFDSTSAYIGVMVTDIALNTTELSLTEGETASLTAAVAPENATDKTVTWTSSDESVATVSDKGVVTAVKAGTATITATSANGKTATCSVTVAANIIPVESIAISKAELSLTEGETAALTATVAPENATDKIVTWSSSDESVATVDNEGNVTAMAVGDAVITATCGNVSANCNVHVLPILVESIVIDPTEWSGEEGNEFKISAVVLPENATDKILTFESSDETVAVVDAEGNVKVLKEGTCIITVSTVDGSNQKAECVITILSGVEAIFADPNALVDVYNMNGMLIKKGCLRGELRLLNPGVYILRSGDSIVKTIIR